MVIDFASVRSDFLVGVSPQEIRHKFWPKYSKCWIGNNVVSFVYHKFKDVTLSTYKCRTCLYTATARSVLSYRHAVCIVAISKSSRLTMLWSILRCYTDAHMDVCRVQKFSEKYQHARSLYIVVNSSDEYRMRNNRWLFNCTVLTTNIEVFFSI